MAESFSKISSMLARDLNIELESSASSRLTEIPSAKRPQEIAKLLNSRNDNEVLRGMRCVISLSSRGEDVAPYFADVVKNITSSVDKINVLVMFYLSRYADVEPETALLSINSIQKLLSLKNTRLRCTAIKTLSNVRINSVVPILLLSIKKVVSDPSAAVRLAAAVAIGNAMEIEDIDRAQLFGYLAKLLGDAETSVVETAIKTYYKVRSQVSKRWEPIHGNFRRLCRILSEMDEWGQVFLIDILTDYCRKFLPKPTLMFRDQEMELPVHYSDIPNQDYEVVADVDLERFLTALKPLVYTRHEVVIIAISRALLALAPPKYFTDYQVNKALVNLTSNNKLRQLIDFALITIRIIIDADKLVFQPYYKRFYLFSTDSTSVAQHKLEILSSLINEDNAKYIIAELKYTSLNYRPEIAYQSIKALGRCSQLSPEWTRAVLKWALQQLHHMDVSLTSELLTVIRFLIQQKQAKGEDRLEITKAIYHLSLILDEDIEWDDDAKSTVIWIIGEFTGATDNMIGPDVLRRLLKTYSSESAPVRYQILVLAAKVYSQNQDNQSSDEYANQVIFQMVQHVLHLAKYDDSYDTRDRARMFSVLLSPDNSNKELAALFFQVPKPIPKMGKSTEANSIDPYFETDAWSDPERLPAASIREELPVVQPKVLAISNATVSPPAGNSSAISSQQSASNMVPASQKRSYKLQSLDEFFAEESESEESSDDGSIEESEDEENEESEGSEAESSGEENTSDDESDTGLLKNEV